MKNFPRLSVLNLLVLVTLSACSKSPIVEPDQTRAAQYEIKTIRYFLSAGDGVDTAVVSLKTVSVQNPSNNVLNQQIEGNYDLPKTSQFILNSASNSLNKVDLSQLEVSVPQHGYRDGSFDYSADKFVLSSTQQTKPYTGYKQQPLTVKIPAQSRIDINRQIDVYHLKCSFEGVLENKTTGQRYALSGKWQGILQYDNLTTNLTQYSLP